MAYTVTLPRRVPEGLELVLRTAEGTESPVEHERVRGRTLRVTAHVYERVNRHGDRLIVRARR